MHGTYDYPETRDTIHLAQSQRDGELAHTVAQIYIETVPVLIQVMRDAVEVGDLRELIRAAEALKLSSAHLGAAQVAELCRRVSEIPSKQQLVTVSAQLDEIAYAARAVCNALQRNHAAPVCA
jgi:HPt (histidine-containing phosphotransfer) domain-containing protein